MRRDTLRRLLAISDSWRSQPLRLFRHGEVAERDSQQSGVSYSEPVAWKVGRDPAQSESIGHRGWKPLCQGRRTSQGE